MNKGDRRIVISHGIVMLVDDDDKARIIKINSERFDYSSREKWGECFFTIYA